MHKFFVTMSYLVLIIIFWLPVSQVCANDSPPLVIYAGEWPPFTSSNSSNQGFFIEIISRAFAFSNIKTEYHFAPWARCFHLVKHQKAFGVIPIARTLEREAEHLFSKPIFTTRNPVLYDRNKFPEYDYTGIDSLKKYQLGAMLGWFYIDEWKKAGLAFHTMNEHHQAFRMLQANRIDLLVFDEFAARYCLEKHPEFKNKIGISKSSYKNKHLYLMTSKAYPKSTALMKKLNTGLDRLRSQEALCKIAKKYRLPEELILPIQ